MGLDGGLRDVEALGDLGVGEALGHAQEHLALALGERREPGVLGLSVVDFRVGQGVARTPRAGGG